MRNFISVRMSWTYEQFVRAIRQEMKLLYDEPETHRNPNSDG